MAKKTKSPVKYVVVDAFADSAFKGNPAAVCLLEEERDESWLQSVATEFKISETCYLTRIHDPNPDSSAVPRFKLRWFNPVGEVMLCGHATLAAPHFCFTYDLVVENIVKFSTLSGILTARKCWRMEVAAPKKTTTVNCQNGELESQFLIKLDLPVVPLINDNTINVSSISEALNGTRVVDIKRTTTEDEIVVILDSSAAVTGLQPQIEKIRLCPGRGVVISSAPPPDSKFDFVSRFLFPKCGIDEDPVCGSAHCALAIYWSKKLGKREFLAYVASPRGGVVKVNLDEQGNRVRLLGKAITIMEGSLLI